MDALVKYPRSRHVEGSGLQRGDDPETVPFVFLKGKSLVVEEKVDGANVGISSDAAGRLQLQCRGHFLTGGPDEAQFALLKPWAQTHQSWLWERLGDRWTLYGEWCYAKHTVFYDALPHYLLEFDVLERATGVFLSTARRRELLDGGPVVSVPVVTEEAFGRRNDLTKLVPPSLYKTANCRERLADHQPDWEARRETDASDPAEGLYVKWESDGAVLGRYKWVRPDFLQAIVDSGSHGKSRPIVANALAEGVALW